MKTCTHQTNLVQQWMQLRKEQGKIACLEKAQSAQTVVGADGQGKTCTVKATLPEPQFAAAYNRRSVAERLTRHTGRKENRALRFSSLVQLARAARASARPAHPLYGGASERTEHLNTSLLSTHVITGCPTAGVGAIRRPVWARSRHITQTPGVTTGTAASLSADGNWNKRRATDAKIQATGGRTAATAFQHLTTEAC
jgi:hypothetical protein